MGKSAEKGHSEGKSMENTIFKGDNIEVMKSLLEKGMESKINMIYIDPPFFSKADYNARILKKGCEVKCGAYSDRWEQGMEGYLQMLRERLILMKRLLADDGLIFVHLDFHAVHYVKVLMDQVFGFDNFVNEIIWQYKSGGSTKRRFSRKHDNILLYSKSPKYRFFPQKEKSYNRDFKPYRFKGVKEYQDDIGWYTLVNMKDVWQINMLGRTSKERTGYPTQKPEKLLKRIIECSTEEGDIVADFFAGSGTLGAAADSLNRRFILCDSGDVAVSLMEERFDKSKTECVIIET